MIARWIIAALAVATPAMAIANPTEPADRDARQAVDGIPALLDPQQRTGYRAFFTALRAERWTDAQIALDSLPPGPLHALAKAELYTARNSPRVEAPQALALLADAPELPQAAQIARIAEIRGATDIPSIPQPQRLTWYDAAPVRMRARSVRSDAAAADIATAIKPFLEADDGRGAEAVVEPRAADLTPEALTEWRQRVALIYYHGGDDTNARRVAALAQAGTGEWAVQADWVQGLASWRQNDCEAAGRAFESVARRADDTEKRSAGLYWAARADIACGKPERVQSRLQSAAQFNETFYGLLARQQLGVIDPAEGDTPQVQAQAWRELQRRPNVRVAAALVEIGENRLADEVIRHQAKIGPASEHASLTRLAGLLNLASTQLWLSHNGPAGARPLRSARYPAPNWTPDGGWRVDRALVFAHALQESKFDANVISRAGAYGLMQIMPAAAVDVGRRRGVTIDRSDLSRPSTNMEVGQSYLEQLRDQPFTGGLLPKVIAAYNAGPTPVARWNGTTRDNGDPLLYIESIPYWETRGYVMIVLRNYWMYERREGRPSPSRAALAQGLWPRFPGLPGATAVRMQAAIPAATAGAN